MKVNRHVRRASVKMRRLDAANASPLRQASNVFGDVVPMCAAVFGFPDQPVVGARPNEVFLHRRWRDGENNLSIKLPQVVPHQAAGGRVMAGILSGEVGTEHPPTLPAVRRFEDHLAAVINRVVIKRIDGQRRSPMAAIFGFVGRRVERVQPRAHRAGHFGFRIPARHLIPVAGCPDDVGICWVGDREAGLATSHAVFPAQLSEVGPAHVPVVLHIGINVVRNLVVHRHVVHLPDGQHHAMESAPVYGGDAQPAIVGNHKTLRVFRVHPNVVVVAAPMHFLKILRPVH